VELTSFFFFLLCLRFADFAEEFHFVLPNGALSKKRLPLGDLLANVVDEVLRTRGTDCLSPSSFFF
jgi:hypothetical protein